MCTVYRYPLILSHTLTSCTLILPEVSLTHAEHPGCENFQQVVAAAGGTDTSSADIDSQSGISFCQPLMIQDSTGTHPVTGIGHEHGTERLTIHIETQHSHRT